MGRKKKTLPVDILKLEQMSNPKKLELINTYNQLFQHELSKIPYKEIIMPIKEKAEFIAKVYYEIEGFKVYHSRVKNGYRCVGVEFYWKQYKSKLPQADKELIRLLKDILTPEDFKELAMMVKVKNGTPDLLLIRDSKISFVEVKYSYETVKPSTVEFFLRYGQRWSISILRILRS